MVKGQSEAVLNTDRPLLEPIDAYNESDTLYET